MSSATETDVESTNRPDDGQVDLLRRRILNWLVLGVVGISATVELIALVGGIARSTAVLLIALLLAVIGISAGGTAAKLRKQHMIDDAIFAYRIAIWCLFLSLIQLPGYYRAKDDERFRQESERRWEWIEKHYRSESEQ